MERVGFTGTRHTNPSDLHMIREVLEDRVSPGAALIVGGCVGADALVAAIGHDLGYYVHTVLPANRSQVDRDWSWSSDTHEEMPGGTDYRARNQRIVELSERLIAFPEYPEAHGKSRRSGTWMTVRLARKAGIPVEIHILRDE